jgi:hypothetical protein
LALLGIAPVPHDNRGQAEEAEDPVGMRGKLERAAPWALAAGAIAVITGAIKAG